MDDDPPLASSDWTNSFFDDGFATISGRLGKYDTTVTDVAAIVALLGLRPGMRVLDVPCGFGRHSALLADRGLLVVGIDSSPHQIKAAADGHSGPSYVVRDMRQPPDGPFDAVLNLWSSFGLLPTPEDDFEALAAWRSVLAPGGKLLMELSTLENHRLRQGGSAPRARRVLEENGVLEETFYDWDHQTVTFQYTYDRCTRTGVMNLYSRSQLRDLMRQAGFETVSEFDGLSKRPGPEDASRLVLVATAPVSAPAAPIGQA